MLLAIDVGNTNTSFFAHEGDNLLGEWRCSTLINRTADEYFVWLRQILQSQDIEVLMINSMVVSSVVPQVVFNLIQLSNKYFGCNPLIVGDKDCTLPISVRVDKGVRVGADRLVNTVGAFHRYGGDLIIVDFGTATTFDVVDTDGAYIGGVIAPGVNLSVRTLHEAAAALPHIEVSRPNKVVGTNTIECMQSGVFWGYIGLINGITAKIQSERKRKLTIIATGGLAPLFATEMDVFDHVDLTVTMAGLIEIYNINFDELEYEH